MNLFITTDIEWSHKEHEPVIYTYDASDIEGNKYRVKVVDGTEDGCTLFFITRGNIEYYLDTQEWSMCPNLVLLSKVFDMLFCVSTRGR